MDEVELEKMLYPSAREVSRPLPDFKYVHTERRRKGVTLQLLWEEYRVEHPDGYSYSQYCEHYKRFAGKLDVVMRQTHRGGDKMFVDYSSRCSVRATSRTPR
jgi:transposase